MIIEDENIDNGSFRGNEQILTNDGHFFDNIKDKECNSGMNYKDIKKDKICENFKGGIRANLKQKTLFTLIFYGDTA